MSFNPEILSSKWIKVAQPFPHVLHVQLSREPVNAFCTEYWQEYGRLFDRIPLEAPDIRAVVVSSTLPRFFTAGLDLNDAMKIAKPANENTDNARKAFGTIDHIKEFQHAIHAVERAPFPVIAAVHGIAIGLGIDMSSCCDIRYAAEDTRFSVKEVDIGLAADIGTLAYLPKVVGNMSLVREYAYTAAQFSAHDAEKMGYVSRVVKGSRDEVVHAALELAKSIAAKSPVAVTGTKRLITHARDHTVAENLDYTAIWNAAALQTKDMADALAATKSKSKPKFAPLRPSSKL